MFCLLLILAGAACMPVLVEEVPVSVPAAAEATAVPPTRLIATVATSEPLPTRDAPRPPTPMPTSTTSDPDPVRITANDPRLRYTGRFDFQDPEQVAFDWSGVSIATWFSGPDLSVLLNDGGNFYDVEINGVTTILETEPQKAQYVLAEGLGAGPHEMVIRKRTEAYVGAGVFSGLVLAPGGRLFDLPEPQGRQLLFVGDSITAGYGIEGDSPECFFTAATQNAARTYAAQVAAAFDADYTLIALSGLGVVRNLRAAEGVSAETAVDFVPRALGMNPFVLYPAAAEDPDVVIINLGTNDFSSLPFPDEVSFVNAYRELLTLLRDRYPDAALIAMAGPLMQGPAWRLISAAVDAQQEMTGDSNVSAVLIEDDLERSAVDFGCDWHPNIAGHTKIAKQLLPALADAAGWPVP